MANVTITTDTASLFSHDVYFTLILSDSASASYNARLLDLGSLKYSFDIPNSGSDTTAIGVKAGSMDIDIENFFIGSSDTLIDTLVSAFTNNKQLWIGKMYYRAKGGTYGNPLFFSFSQSDIEYDEQSEKVSISLIPKQEIGYYTGTFVETIEAQVDSYDITYEGSNTEHLILAGEYVRQYLYQMYVESATYPITEEPIIKSPELITGNPSTGTEWFVAYGATQPPDPKRYYDTVVAEITIGSLATFEGAIYGAALGKPFYVERKNTDNKVTISTDNIVRIRQDPFFEAPYRNVFLTQRQNISDNILDIEETLASDNPQAEKDINILISGIRLRRIQIDTSSTGTRLDIDDSLITHGVQNYSLAFSFENAGKVYVKAWGIDDIYPYSVINFDVNAPDFVQSKNFRVKMAEYSFKQDSVELELYEI